LKFFELKTVPAFFRLIRWPNLVFILLTQGMFEYCVLRPVFVSASIHNNLHGVYFLLITFSHVLIAAAGYIINDYFDQNIDTINKPNKVIVTRVINRRWVLLWHILLSLLAIALSFYVDANTSSKIAGISAIICVVLLFLYSTTLKKKVLIGNILVSALAAFSIVSLTWFEGNQFFLLHARNSRVEIAQIFWFTVLYAVFAFVISLIREVVKDMEDIEGDRKYGCKTMPIVWGLTVSKVFVSVWLIVLIAVLFIIEIYVLQFGWWGSAVYCILLIIVPLLWVIRKLFVARFSKDFHLLSTVIKMIMLSGILSMIFIKYYH
jgi:4-hydroxybenzoate polyprenyltransferase